MHCLRKLRRTAAHRDRLVAIAATQRRQFHVRRSLDRQGVVALAVVAVMRLDRRNPLHLQQAVKQIKVELTQRLEELRKAGRLLEAERLEQRTAFDIEMIEATGSLMSVEAISVMSRTEPTAPMYDPFPSFSGIARIQRIFSFSSGFVTRVQTMVIPFSLLTIL